MPIATAEAPDSAPASEATAAVLDVALFNTPQKSMQLLNYAGLINSDTDMSALGLLKRLNHAAFADPMDEGADRATRQAMLDLQQDFRQKLKGMSYDELVGGGHVNALLTDYLTLLKDYHQGVVNRLESEPASEHDRHNTALFKSKLARAEAQRDKYALELEYWQKNPEIVQNIAAQYPQALQAGKYLSLAQLAVATRIVKGNADVAADMVDDVMANATAHSLKLLMPTTPAEHLEMWKTDPDKYATQIAIEQGGIQDKTTPLAQARVNEGASPGLARVQALHTLLSAQLNAAMTAQPGPDGKPREPDSATLITEMLGARELIRDYQSAAMSLVHAFFAEGAGANDGRMKRMRDYLGAMMEKENIPLLSREEAEAKAAALAEDSASRLMLIAEGNDALTGKLKTLLKQVNPKLTEIALGEGMVTKLGAVLRNVTSLMQQFGGLIAPARSDQGRGV